MMSTNFSERQYSMEKTDVNILEIRGLCHEITMSTGYYIILRKLTTTGTSLLSRNYSLIYRTNYKRMHCKNLTRNENKTICCI